MKQPAARGVCKVGKRRAGQTRYDPSRSRARSGALRTTHHGLRSPSLLGLRQTVAAVISRDTLIASGGETDVCVLASVLAAVDFGCRVIIAEDAVCNSSDESHDALLNLYTQRFGLQIEVASAAAIVGAWPTD